MLLSFLLLTSVATAEDPGKFTIMGTNECARYEGVLFDVSATAEILARANVRTAECNLRVDTELEKKEIEFGFERENFDIRYTSLKDEYDLVLEQKRFRDRKLARNDKETLSKKPVDVVCGRRRQRDCRYLWGI